MNLRTPKSRQTGPQWTRHDSREKPRQPARSVRKVGASDSQIHTGEIKDFICSGGERYLSPPVVVSTQHTQTHTHTQTDTDTHTQSTQRKTERARAEPQMRGTLG